MRCDTVREMFDDWDRNRLPGVLVDEITAHLAECSECAVARKQHLHVVAALGRLPKPALPPGFEATLIRRLEALPVWGNRERGWSLAAFRYALAAAAGALATAAALFAFPPSSNDGGDPVFDQPTGNPPAGRVPEIPMDPSRVLKDGEGLRVSRGDDVAITVSVQAPEPVEGAKVHVVLPPGLVFSPDDHPDHADKRVLTVVEDLDADPRDIDFTVRGERLGRWEVMALVENGDSIEVAGTVIVVSGKEEEL